MKAADARVQPTQILRNEHEVILRVLDCLEKLAQDSRRDGGLDLRTADELLDFLRVFADQCHHGKEEDSLFPMLSRKGLPTQVGPIAVMLSEHEQGRAEIAGMHAAAERCRSGHPAGAVHFAAHARAYVDLLRDHIAKENNVLFPMAEGMLDDADRERIVAEFRTHESKDIGPGTHERYLARVDEWVERLHVPAAVRPHFHAGACCGGRASCG
jgi:hemerythrin-like domain-containing protein